MSTWLVTGANRGLGAAVAHSALEAGHIVIATGRDVDAVSARLASVAGERLRAERLDLVDSDTIATKVTDMIDRHGPVDVLVNNAGYGQLGIFEEIGAEDVRAQFDVNVLGAMEVTRGVLPSMRARRAGRIIAVSSIGGIAGFGGASVYCASKYAIEGFFGSLAQETAPLGISVTTVAPGYFRTDFLDDTSLRWGTAHLEDYEVVSRPFLESHESLNHNQPGDPERFGRFVVELSESEDPPVQALAGSDASGLAIASLGARLAHARSTETHAKSTDF